MRPFQVGTIRHASITASDTRGLRLFSIRQDQHGMRQFGIQIRPACVYCTFGGAGMRHLRLGGAGACVHFAFGQAGLRPFPPGHASISGSAKRELASISGSDGASMRQFGIQIRPACVYCTFGGAGMRHFRLRRSRGMRPFRIRPSRLASISAGACVYFEVGWREHASIRDSDRPACVYSTFGGAGMRHIRLRRSRGMRPFRIRPSRLASISAGACVYFRIG